MNSPEWVVVFDCDGTLIPKSYGSLYDIVDKNGGLNGKYLKASDEMRRHYLSLPTLTLKDQKDWFIDTMHGYIQSGLTVDTIIAALRGVKFRVDVLDCFQRLKNRNTPQAIVSYGIAPFIHQVIKENSAHGLLDKVYAAELFFNDDLQVNGFDMDTVVFPENKGEFSLKFAKLQGVPPERILAVGDSHVGDRNLGYLPENRLGIAEDAAQAEKLKACMGHVVISHDFAPVTRWLEEKMDGK